MRLLSIKDSTSVGPSRPAEHAAHVHGSAARTLLMQVLSIHLAPSLPTSNTHKTCVLTIWVLQTQLSKDAKKGTSVDRPPRGARPRPARARALCARVQAAPAMPSVLANLLSPTLNLCPLHLTLQSLEGLPADAEVSGYAATWAQWAG
ncbi:hypothetical protein FA95DRAFT_1613153 [Auriscalpium vulgare]|uniref:Uncharacterized protein n=1 Tax=Auriscalpium vulgare TaxID=40419 RepID=A0ACB8R3N2_9AGAM|nr:hypothetical protein FA95DRAFT_1613153 [Auriscalpium vulgare]